MLLFSLALKFTMHLGFFRCQLFQLELSKIAQYGHTADVIGVPILIENISYLGRVWQKHLHIFSLKILF